MRTLREISDELSVMFLVMILIVSRRLRSMVEV